MNRLTTDTPHGNFETMMNFAYAKNGEVWIRGAGGDGGDMKLNEYIFDVLQGDKYYCEVDHPDDIPEFCLDACFCELGALFAAATQAAELRARLAAYEDTGLEPDEAEACKVALMGKSLAEIKEIEGISVERMKDLAKAEAEAKLLVLPCKVGDTIYEIDLPEYGVIVCKVIWIDYYIGPAAHIQGNEMVAAVSVSVEVIDGHGKGSCYAFEQSDFGKTVFLTREEAEAALKVGGEDG
ncbi:MAG: hypothetical protein IKO68_00175 [Oscillospiraceae bacterium]|nr:hypothetical protein [Oscillospiraceae bacterium]MBR4655009.1 hypothetical protein [Oscillospiraceae bacterium]